HFCWSYHGRLSAASAIDGSEFCPAHCRVDLPRRGQRLPALPALVRQKPRLGCRQSLTLGGIGCAVHTLDELESAMVDLGPACGHRGVAGSRGDRRITRAVVIVGFTVS